MSDAPHSLGHLAHTVLLAGGVAGMAALLLPQAAVRAGVVGRRTPGSADAVADRAEALRRSAAAGTLALDVRRSAPAPTTRAGEPSGTAAGGRAVAVVVVGTASAGAAHLVVALHHALHPGVHHVLLPALLLGAAAAQLLLARALTTGRHHRGDLLVAGAVLQVSVLGAWLLGRTAGLPAWLHDGGPEPVGPWGVACLVWQVAVVVAALRALATARADGADEPPGPAWAGPATTAWAVGSATAVLALTMAGAAS